MSHSLIALGQRPHAAIDGEVELTDARALARAVWRKVEVPTYQEIELGHGAVVLFVGESGAGKSTQLALMTDGMPGPALLVSVEEPGGPTLAGRFARLGIKRPDLFIASHATVDQIVHIVRDRKIKILAIDSAQRGMFQARELRHLALTLTSVEALLVTSQINKAGDIRGSEELRHEADVIIEVAAMRWRITKSRYQRIGVEGSVLKEERDAS